MNNKELYKLLQTVQKNIRCPQCGKEYLFSRIKIRGIMESIVFLELSCTNTSHMPVLATVTLSKNQMTKSIRDQKKISSDDVLEAYKAIQEFDGGFEKIFENKLK